jgi:hypothetical protein
MSEAIPPFPQYALMAWCLVKAPGQLYLYICGGSHKLDRVQWRVLVNAAMNVGSVSSLAEFAGLTAVI